MVIVEDTFALEVRSKTENRKNQGQLRFFKLSTKKCPDTLGYECKRGIEITKCLRFAKYLFVSSFLSCVMQGVVVSHLNLAVLKAVPMVVS